MDAVEQADVRSLFTQLVTPGDDGDDLRRPRAPPTSSRTVSPAVIDKYRRTGFSSRDHHPITRQPTIEVAHEALLREWPRLRGWIDEDRDAIRVRRAITQAAPNGRPGSRRIDALPGAPARRRRRRRRAHDARADEREFLAGEPRARRPRGRGARRRAAAQSRQNRRFGGCSSRPRSCVIALLFGGYAARQRSRADQRHARAQAIAENAQINRRFAEVPSLGDKNRTLALLLAAQARQLRPDAASRRRALRHAGR